MEHYTQFSNYDAILTIVDYYSKKVWAVPLRHGYTALNNFKALMSVCEKEQTYPHIIQVDNGATFKGLFKSSIDLHNKMKPNQKIKLVYTTPYNPTSNGMVERLNREIRKKK
jgi:transposase InsO family protein